MGGCRLLVRGMIDKEEYGTVRQRKYYDSLGSRLLSDSSAHQAPPHLRPVALVTLPTNPAAHRYGQPLKADSTP